jgi:hypothetical protein
MVPIQAWGIVISKRSMMVDFIFCDPWSKSTC